MGWYIWLRTALAVVLLALGFYGLLKGDFQLGLLVLAIAQICLLEIRLELVDDKIDSLRRSWW